MHRVLSRVLRLCSIATVAAVAVTACAEYESATDLQPEGPPMVAQVRLLERYADETNPALTRSRRVFAFGDHPLADVSEVAQRRPGDGKVTRAAANPNSLRVIMDELLVGNYIEEIACRGAVDDDALARVPVGATPEDIARCSSADDVLPATCPGNNALSVCICNNDAGCIRGTDMVMKGQPVGVLDIDQDGAADETRMIPGSVGIRCGTIDVPINLDTSYWNPSGDQNRPAMGGFDALGPAIVLAPNGPLPTNIDCGLTFSAEVVDKQGQGVCTPSGGDFRAGSCNPGELGAFSFRVEPLEITPSSFNNMDTGVPREGPYLFATNAPVDVASLSNVTVTPAPPAGVTLTFSSPMATTIRVTVMGGTLAADTQYTVTFPTTVTDTFGQMLPSVAIYTFTTGQQ